MSVARAGARHAGRLKLSLALVVGFLVVQVVVGITTHSLALLSDAGHMATDALGLAMALAAITAATRAARPNGTNGAGARTFGLYRLEILAALGNAVLLFAVAGYVLVEAGRRFGEPPHISSLPVLLVGILGLAVNVVGFLLLRAGAQESLNVRGAYLEVLSDLLGSVGVIVGASVMWATGWHWVDPVVGAAIGLFILPRAYRLGRDAMRVLVQAAPRDLQVDDIHAALASLAGVADVHDLHVWTLTSDMEVLTAHLTVAEGVPTQPLLSAARTLLAERFGLTHATLQVEEGGDHRCHDLSW
ncbi:MAG: cation diffusion facilitator family transporter [Actinomycetota bacterium]|nr:cation diffusion facilitator family transporter [Actinomycetota bacterium]